MCENSTKLFRAVPVFSLFSLDQIVVFQYTLRLTHTLLTGDGRACQPEIYACAARKLWYTLGGLFSVFWSPCTVETSICSIVVDGVFVVNDTSIHVTLYFGNCLITDRM